MNLQTLNSFISQLAMIDWIIIIILFAFILKGLFAGLVKEVVTIVFLILAFLLAAKFYPFIEQQPLMQKIPYNNVRIAISFVAIFIIIYGFGLLFNKILTSIVDITGLGFINRLLGAVVGFIKASVLIIFAVLLMQKTSVVNNEGWNKNKLLNKYKNIANYVLPKLPKQLYFLKNNNIRK